eukprot:270841_1
MVSFCAVVSIFYFIECCIGRIYSDDYYYEYGFDENLFLDMDTNNDIDITFTDWFDDKIWNDISSIKTSSNDIIIKKCIYNSCVCHYKNDYLTHKFYSCYTESGSTANDHHAYDDDIDNAYESFDNNYNYYYNIMDMTDMMTLQNLVMSTRVDIREKPMVDAGDRSLYRASRNVRGMQYHHIIPYSLLRTLWDAIANCEHFGEQYNTAQSKIRIYLAPILEAMKVLIADNSEYTQNMGVAPRSTRVVTFINYLLSPGRGRQARDWNAFTARRQETIWTDFQLLYDWLPGNLFEGPRDRADDPGHTFEAKAKKLLLNTFDGTNINEKKAVWTELRDSYDVMVKFVVYAYVGPHDRMQSLSRWYHSELDAYKYNEMQRLNNRLHTFITNALADDNGKNVKCIKFEGAMNSYNDLIPKVQEHLAQLMHEKPTLARAIKRQYHSLQNKKKRNDLNRGEKQEWKRVQELYAPWKILHDKYVEHERKYHEITEYQTAFDVPSRFKKNLLKTYYMKREYFNNNADGYNGFKVLLDAIQSFATILMKPGRTIPRYDASKWTTEGEQKKLK